jgi:hypothetical protein
MKLLNLSEPWIPHVQSESIMETDLQSCFIIIKPILQSTVEGIQRALNSVLPWVIILMTPMTIIIIHYDGGIS